LVKFLWQNLLDCKDILAAYDSKIGEELAKAKCTDMKKIFWLKTPADKRCANDQELVKIRDIRLRLELSSEDASKKGGC